jgi:hypothetical protein
MRRLVAVFACLALAQAFGTLDSADVNDQF